MSDNPYKAPESELNDLANKSNTQFYVVSIRKFTTLYFVTLGLYGFYWFYRNWKEYKTHGTTNIWPIPRAIFSIFFTHSLFSEVQNCLKNNNQTFDWKPNSLATSYVILAIISQILDKMSMKEIGSPVSDILSIFMLPLIFIPLLKAQKAINFSQGDPKGNANKSFTAANYIWVVIGILLWFVMLMGLIVMNGFNN